MSTRRKAAKQRRPRARQRPTPADLQHADFALMIDAGRLASRIQRLVRRGVDLLRAIGPRTRAEHEELARIRVTLGPLARSPAARKVQKVAASDHLAARVILIYLQLTREAQNGEAAGDLRQLRARLKDRRSLTTDDKGVVSEMAKRWSGWPAPRPLDQPRQRDAPREEIVRLAFGGTRVTYEEFVRFVEMEIVPELLGKRRVRGAFPYRELAIKIIRKRYTNLTPKSIAEIVTYQRKTFELPAQ